MELPEYRRHSVARVRCYGPLGRCPGTLSRLNGNEDRVQVVARLPAFPTSLIHHDIEVVRRATIVARTYPLREAVVTHFENRSGTGFAAKHDHGARRLETCPFQTDA